MICSKTQVGTNKMQFEFCKEFGVQETSWRIFTQLLYHLLEKSLLKYPVVRSAVCLNPLYEKSCESHMNILLQKLVSLGRISARSTELIKKQYQKFFIVVDQNQHLFLSFNLTNNVVDTLFPETIKLSDQYGDLWEFTKMFLILFHGQSEVERGFRATSC